MIVAEHHSRRFIADQTRAGHMQLHAGEVASLPSRRLPIVKLFFMGLAAWGLVFGGIASLIFLAAVIR